MISPRDHPILFSPLIMIALVLDRLFEAKVWHVSTRHYGDVYGPEDLPRVRAFVARFPKLEGVQLIWRHIPGIEMRMESKQCR